MGKAEHIVRSAKGDGASNDEVMSPPYLLETIERVLGPIGLDPCSHPRSVVRSMTAIMLPKYAPAVAQFARRTVYADGLQVVWRGHGLCYMNAPYSQPLLKLFLAKMARDCDEGVALVPVRTGNKFWAEAAAKADVKIYLPRVKHLGAKTHSPFHQALLYYGSRIELALGLSALGALDVHVHARHTILRIGASDRGD